MTNAFNTRRFLAAGPSFELPMVILLSLEVRIILVSRLQRESDAHDKFHKST